MKGSYRWRDIKDRLEAWRNGKSLTEIVPRQTRLQQVEQVFLIHRKTGLLLHHVAADSAFVQQADMLSGMLTAIQGFAGNSFDLKDEEDLEILQLGDVSVWIENGPLAVLAAVVYGTAPEELRTHLYKATESIHEQYAEALVSFDGDAETFENAQCILRPLLRTFATGV